MQSGLWRDSYGSPKAHKNPVRGVMSDTLNQIVVTGGGTKVKFWRFKNKGKMLYITNCSLTTFFY